MSEELRGLLLLIPNDGDRARALELFTDGRWEMRSYLPNRVGAAIGRAHARQSGEWIMHLEATLDAEKETRITAQARVRQLTESLEQLVDAVDEERRWATGTSPHADARSALYLLVEHLRDTVLPTPPAGEPR